MFIDFGKIDFKCPYCSKRYFDEDDKYLNRIHKNKKTYTTLKCECSSKFGISYDYKGQMVGFKLTNYYEN